jgi:predicted nucleotidyltransferase
MKAHEIPQSVRLALEELKGALVEVYGERPEGVYLYGSYARGDFTEDSDIDVLLVLKGDVKPGAEITDLFIDIRCEGVSIGEFLERASNA